jgi:hypothetical protein
MTVPAIVTADAIVAALNAATLSQTVTFTRVWVPKFDTTEAAMVQGKVVPVTDDREMGSAADDNATIVVDVGVMKRLQNSIATETAEIDALMELCEEIKPLLNRERFGDAIVSKPPSQNPLVSVEELDSGRVFLVAVRVEFLTTVAI